MDWPLIFFVLVIAAVVISAVAFLRSAIGASIITVASAHAKIYALAYVKCSLLMSIAMIGSFKETFHSVTMGQADNWTWWDWSIAFGNQFNAAFAVMVAFLDRSVQNAQNPTLPSP